MDEFRDSWKIRLERKYEKGTNLCHFMRVILLWAPLVLLLHLVLYGGAIAALTIVPVYWFGLSGYLGLILGLVVFIFLCVLAGFASAGIGKSINYVVLRSRKSRQKSGTEEIPEPLTNEKIGPSFGEVLWEYAVATKRRICPIINFKNAEVQS
jgi:hypothetical protein